MTRKCSAAVLAAALFCAIPAPGGADSRRPGERPVPGFSLKIFGGPGCLSTGGGDLETLRTSTAALFESVKNISAFSPTFNWPGLALASEFGAELIIPLCDHLGIGLGSGYITGGKSRGRYSYVYSIAQFLQGTGYSVDNRANYAQDFAFHAVPVRINLYVFQPLGRLSIYGYGGAGYYFGSIHHTYSMDAALQTKNLSTYAPQSEHDTDLKTRIDERVHGGAIGFQAGLGIEVGITRRISLGLEAFGRIANLKNWEGDGSVSTETRNRDFVQGVGWYSDQTQSDAFRTAGKWRYVNDYDPSSTLAFFSDNLLVEKSVKQPSVYEKTRDPAIDLSGIGARLSLRYRF